MNNKLSIFAFVLMGVSASCDDGDIRPKDAEDTGTGIKVQTTLTFSGVAGWPTESTLVMAAFGADDEHYPLVSKTIEKVPEGNKVEVTLNNIPREAEYASVCIIEKGRKLVYAFTRFDLANGTTMPAQTVGLLPYDRVQKQVFSQCVACHGGGASAAAGLYLTEGKSYEALVGVMAANADKKLVEAGLVSGSFLIDVLKNKSGLRYDHTDISSFDSEDLGLLEAWIEAGAKNEQKQMQQNE